MPYLIQTLREQNQILAKITSQLGDMDEKIDETKEVAQKAVSLSQAPPGFAASASFPDGGFQPTFPDPNMQNQGFNNNNNFGMAASTDPFNNGNNNMSAAQQTFNRNSAGGFPAFNNTQFPPF